VPDATWPVDPVKKAANIHYFNLHKEEFAKQYPNVFIALNNGKVTAAGKYIPSYLTYS
jgi:hypothetical protein